MLERPPTAFWKQLDSIPFVFSFLAVLAFIVYAIASPRVFIHFMDGLQTLITRDLGWAFVFAGFLIILFAFAIVVSPIGSIRIGGREAKPDFGVIRWFSISLCSGIGIGILFWGIGEPVYHLMLPPSNLGIVPGSHDAALFAISQTVLHWSVAQYCIYALCGLAFALTAFNGKAPLSIMSGLAPIMPKAHYTLIKNIVHTACLFSICCAVISSIGALIMLVSCCLSHLTGFERGFAMNAVVALIATVFFVMSAATGLRRGMAFLSTQNTRMFFCILLFIFFCGPTIFILNMGAESFGYLLAHFFRHSTLVSSEFTPDRWADSWLIVYMAFFFGYGPPIGLYLARLGKGRTVRQFLLMNVLAPTVFVYFWINTFGSLAIYYQWKGIVDVWQFVQVQGLESTVIGILQRFPLSMALIGMFILVTIISFVTLVDPMTCVLATISTKGISAEAEAPRALKIIWGCNMGGVALAAVTLGGISALRSMAILSGVLMLFLTLALCLSIVKTGAALLRCDAGS